MTRVGQLADVDTDCSLSRYAKRDFNATNQRPEDGLSWAKMGTSDHRLKKSAEISSGLEKALGEQFEELSARVVQHRERAELLQRLADQATAQAGVDERLLEELAGVLGNACQLRIEQLDRRLRGRRLQEIAVEILAARLDPGQTIHYKQWFDWVEGEGFRVAGKDPLATFLAQISRSPRIVSAGRRSGLYMLSDAA